VLGTPDYIFGLVLLAVLGYSAIRKKFTALYALFTSLLLNVILKYLSSHPTALFTPNVGPSMVIQVFTTLGFEFHFLWVLALAYVIFRPTSWWSTLSAGLIGLGMGFWIKKKSRKIVEGAQEVRRKTFHTIAGLIMGLVAIVVSQRAAIMIAGIGLIFTFAFPFAKQTAMGKVAKSMIRSEEEDPGMTLFKFGLGCLLPLLLNQPWIVLVIAIGDGMSAMIGRFFGSTKLYKQKSLEGTLAGFLGAWAVAMQFAPTPLLAAVVYALTELFAPLDDNLMVPIVLSLLYLPWSHVITWTLALF